MHHPILPIPFIFAGLAVAGAALTAPRQALAQAEGAANDDRAAVQFALLRYPGGRFDPRPKGLERLAWEIRKRTSIGMSLETAVVTADDPALFAHPFVVWQGDAAFPPLSENGVVQLRQHLSMGGTLLVDVSDGQVDGGFHRSVVRELGRIFPSRPITRVPVEHVVYKSFYLIDRHGGRVPARSFLEGIFVEDRLAVVISTNDLAGAMARDEFGEWVHDVGAGGDVTREMTFRLGINMVMYALCLDYKEDQVHIPFILQRRR